MSKHVAATLLIVTFGMLSDAASGQGFTFTQAQAYERFMGRWSARRSAK